MKTNYEKQAMDFLEKTGCKMTITYKENRKYFPDDKETRDVYDIKIERGKRVWKFEFGNSITNSEFVAVYGKRRYKIPSEMRTKSNAEIAWYVKRNLQFDFGTVNADHIIRPVAPSEYRLGCLTKYDPGSFVDFAANLDRFDSKSAERTYAGKRVANVCVFGMTEIEEFGNKLNGSVVLIIIRIMKTYLLSLLIVVLLIAILAAILQPGIWTALNAVGTAVLFAGGILICKYYRF